MKYYTLIYTGKKRIGIESGELLGNRYDFTDACDTCGTNAKLVENLVVKGFDKIKKDFFATLDDDYIVSKNLFNELILNKVNLPGIKKVVDKKGNLLTFYHLTSDYIFPPFHPKSSGLKTDRQCASCRRNGYFGEIIMGDLEKGIKIK